MNERVTAIIEQARKLTPEEQRELLHRLLSDDEPAEGTPEEIEAAWVEECERRVAAYERGETTAVDFDTVMARARALLRRK
ncbi:MAG: addiction module protein [Hyphomicrobiaceae bacterium]